MKSNLAIVFLVITLIGTNAYWFAMVLDQGITQTYMASSLEMSKKQYEQSVVLFNLGLIGLSSEEAVNRIRKDVYDLEPFIKEGCIWAGQVCLSLENDRVTGINHDPL